MALIVEDGSNVASADALADLAFVTAYHAGNSAWGTDVPAQENAIKRATSRLGTAYIWSGTRTNGRSQSLYWPRTDVVDCEGIEIGDNEIPDEVKKSVAEMAILELLSPSYQTATTAAAASTTAQVKMEKVGELEVEYFELKDGETVSTTNATQSLSIVNALLRCFAIPVDGASLSGGNYAACGTVNRI